MEVCYEKSNKQYSFNENSRGAVLIIAIVGHSK
jgi:hypothetical protein